MHKLCVRAAWTWAVWASGAASVFGAPNAAEVAAESAKANAFFENAFQKELARHPEVQSQLGMKDNYDKWDDASEAAQAEDVALALSHLAELRRTINFDALDAQAKVSYRLWVRRAELAAEAYKWRHHTYPVNQMFGQHSAVPAFLINYHRIDNVADAEAYIARLRGIKGKFDELIVQLELRRARGVVPPRFVFPLVLESCRNLIAGEPFDAKGAKNPLLEDFEGKLLKVGLIDAPSRTRLTEAAKEALRSSVKPAYEALIAKLEALAKVATDEDGAWKFPDGGTYYEYALREMTTTRMSADQIHELGLKEVGRIHAEMAAIKDKTAFKGDLSSFFKFMREDKRFYYPNTAEGKAEYLKSATETIDRMRTRLDDLFLTKPKAAIIVKPVEPFRERESGGAFYEPPALDGSRPGMYYVNLYDMSAQPKYEIEALAYHEGIPGHHMQIAIAQELQGVPLFRRVDFGFTAYVEGWALYCERVPKELGFYSDPYSDFGRLSMELWRAARLVVDTGLHARKWTRQQTIDWLRTNTPNSERDILTETNRYIVMPGQATAYKVGMIKIQQLREKAAQALHAKFDVREYHDVVLKNGALPLELLEELVDAWITQKKG